jgi:hypothetical protein
MAVVTSVRITDKIKVTQTAYDLAMKLFAAQANKKPVPVTKEMLASKLSELTDKKKGLLGLWWIVCRSWP